MADSQNKPRPSDVAASRMGELLLKGYRMLDASCEFCNTVIMQDRNGKNICVLCGDRNEAPMDREIGDASGSRRVPAQKHVLEDDTGSSSTANKRGLKSGLGSDDVDLSTVILDVVREMKATGAYLEVVRERGDGTHLLAERQQLLKHVQMCAQTLAELKSLQQ